MNWASHLIHMENRETCIYTRVGKKVGDEEGGEYGGFWGRGANLRAVGLAPWLIKIRKKKEK